MSKLVVILAALSLSLGGAHASFAQGRPALVNIDTVIVEPLAQITPVLGRFVARQSGVVAALTRGPVSKLLVDVGDRVNKGDVLVQLVDIDHTSRTGSSSS